VVVNLLEKIMQTNNYKSDPKIDTIQARVDHIIVSSAGGVLIGAAIGSAIFPAIGSVLGAGIAAVTFGVVDFLCGTSRKKET
jgi:hypothetical protein